MHAYGALCQAITEVASTRNVPIESREFHALNRCLDVALAGAVTEYEHSQDAISDAASGRATTLTQEMQNTVKRARAAFQAIQGGTVGVGGSTGQLLRVSLDRLEELIERLLTGGEAARTGGEPGQPRLPR